MNWKGYRRKETCLNHGKSLQRLYRMMKSFSLDVQCPLTMIGAEHLLNTITAIKIKIL
jgi:hypothetical protein